MAKFDKKVHVFDLRRAGKSITYIAKKLSLSKSTISVWCQDIHLTPSQAAKLKRNSILGGHKGRMLGTETNRQKKINSISREYNLAKQELRTLTNRDLLLLSIALYWSEGSKTDSRFTFVNSDPVMIELMCQFLQRIMGVEKRQLSVTIQINELHRDRIKAVMEFWSSYLEIPLNQFKQPYYVKAKLKKVYENHHTHFGVARLRVLQSSRLKYRMLGYIHTLKEQVVGIKNSSQEVFI